MQGFCFYCDIREFSSLGIPRCEFRIENVETVAELIQLAEMHKKLAHNG